MRVKEFLARYDAGESFDERELQDIFWLDFLEDEDDIEQMIEVADERMYADKAVYKSTMSGKIPIRDIYGT